MTANKARLVVWFISFYCPKTRLSVLYSFVCCRNPLSYKIVVGDHNRNINEGTEEEVGAKKVISHPNYNSPRLSSDIALIQLSSPVKLSQRVNPICLPNHDSDVPTGSKCYITGIWNEDLFLREVFRVKFKKNKVKLITYFNIFLVPSKSKAILHDIERCMAKIMFDNFGSLKFSMMNTNMRTSLSQFPSTFWMGKNKTTTTTTKVIGKKEERSWLCLAVQRVRNDAHTRSFS